jgi:phage tail tube protein FII
MRREAPPPQLSIVNRQLPQKETKMFTRPEVIKDFNVYNAYNLLIPLKGAAAEWTLPNLQFLSSDFDAAGTNGPLSFPILGKVQAVSFELPFVARSSDFYRNGALLLPSYVIRASIQAVDQLGVAIVEKPFVIRFKGLVAGMNFGSLKRGVSNPSKSFSCLFYEELFDGKIVTRWGSIEDSFILDGVDMNALTKLYT